MPSTRTIMAVLLMAAVLALATGCRLVGSGTLGHVTYAFPDYPQPAAASGSVVAIQVFRPDSGDVWPPPATLGLRVRAEDVPALHALPGPKAEERYRWEHSLYLMRLYTSTEEADPLQRQYRTCDEVNQYGMVYTPSRRIGPIVLNPGGTIDTFLTIDDTPENRQASWVLVSDYFGPSPLGAAIRCGTLTWEAP